MPDNYFNYFMKKRLQACRPSLKIVFNLGKSVSIWIVGARARVGPVFNRALVQSL